jgi:hypothetical protein
MSCELHPRETLDIILFSLNGVRLERGFVTIVC